MNNLQNTKYLMFNIEVLKTIFTLVESAKYEFRENMNLLLRHLFTGNISFIYNFLLLDFFVMVTFHLKQIIYFINKDFNFNYRLTFISL